MSSQLPIHHLHTQHQRQFENNRFVYPVLSRRSGGISIGVNLNPDKICNFDCIYCQVDRTTTSETTFVETDQLFEELEDLLRYVSSGEIYTHPKFQETPEPLRRLNDIAFSGDGEPTTYRNFDQLIEKSAEIKRRLKLDDVKMVLITNASMFQRDHVQRGLQILDQNQGEIWAKLDAGTSDYYHLIERTKIPFQRILDNILLVGKQRPIVLQSMFMRVEDVPPSVDEQLAFCDRLQELISAGAQIKYIHLYTVARKPAESIVTPMSNEELDTFAERIRNRTKLPVETYYGSA